ncbi:transposase [Streptomyces sp. NPDC012765]|uniref:transposase n=1 Tax=Streptomyces sp. NPDC012765 TaxID=3155249 RepID=UPI0033E2E2A3
MRPRRYPSDTTDTEWALMEPLLPAPACETETGGAPEKHPRREIVDAIRYVVDKAASGELSRPTTRPGARSGTSWRDGPRPASSARSATTCAAASAATWARAPEPSRP